MISYWCYTNNVYVESYVLNNNMTIKTGTLKILMLLDTLCAPWSRFYDFPQYACSSEKSFLLNVHMNIGSQYYGTFFVLN